MRRTRITHALLIFLVALSGVSLACNLTGPAPADTPTAATIPPTVTETPAPAFTDTPTATSGPTDLCGCARCRASCDRGYEQISQNLLERASPGQSRQHLYPRRR